MLDWKCNCCMFCSTGKEFGGNDKSFGFDLFLQKSNFKLYEQYVVNKSQSERVWEQFCSGHPFFTVKKISFQTLFSHAYFQYLENSTITWPSSSTGFLSSQTYPTNNTVSTSLKSK